jgi:carboxypeptidase X2
MLELCQALFGRSFAQFPNSLKLLISARAPECQPPQEGRWGGGKGIAFPVAALPRRGPPGQCGGRLPLSAQAPECPSARVPDRMPLSARVPECPSARVPECQPSQEGRRGGGKGIAFPLAAPPRRGPLGQCGGRLPLSARVPECPSARVPECPSARVPECPSARAPECPSARVPECPSARVPERPSARAPECPSARVLECPSARVPAAAGRALGRRVGDCLPRSSATP